MNYIPKKIFVTGASGFIGSHLCKTLFSRGHAVMGIDRKKNDGLALGVELIVDDIFKADWGPIFAWKPEIFVHLAGPANVRKSFESSYDEVYDSLLLTAFITDKWKHLPSMKLLYVSSSGVYGDHPEWRYSEELSCAPVSPYGACKLASEQLVKIIAEKLNSNYLIVRPFSVYGPGLRKQVVYDLTCRFLKANQPLEIVGTGREERDFIHVKDLCLAFALLCEKSQWDERILNIGTGNSVTLSEIVRLLADLTECQHQYKFIGRDSRGNPSRLVADISRLQQIVDFYTKIPLEQGLAEIVATIKDELTRNL